MMRCILILWVLPALLFSGCSSTPTRRFNSEHRRAEVERRLHEILDAVARKDADRLDSYHLYGPAFSKFESNGSAREDAAEAREKEHQALNIPGLAMDVQDLKIDLFGNVAVATFIINASFTSGAETVQKKARSSLVFVKDAGDWKIAHEHFSEYKPSGP